MKSQNKQIEMNMFGCGICVCNVGHSLCYSHAAWYAWNAADGSRWPPSHAGSPARHDAWRYYLYSNYDLPYRYIIFKLKRSEIDKL